MKKIKDGDRVIDWSFFNYSFEVQLSEYRKWHRNYWMGKNV